MLTVEDGCTQRVTRLMRTGIVSEYIFYYPFHRTLFQFQTIREFSDILALFHGTLLAINIVSCYLILGQE